MRTKLLTFLLITVICLILVYSIGTISNNIVGIAGSIIASFIIMVTDFIVKNIGHFKLYFLSKLFFKEKHIRVSISYLFRIKVDNKYFLVKGNRIQQYAPVGGVYKRYQDSLDVMRKYEVLDDDLIPIDASSKDDLRIRIKGKHLIEFLNWFNQNHGREISAEREFHEELISTNILPRNLFPYAKYKFIKRVNEGIKFDVHVNNHQVLIADVYELILDQTQENYIRNLPNNPNLYSLEAESSINRLGADRSGLPIGRHTSWTL